MSLDHVKKAPAPPPMWVAILREAAIDEHLDTATPSRRALLVARAILDDAPSENRETFVHRFAVALDREPLRLYELERHVSPAALQFDIVDRLIVQFSQEGETVFDPFGGLMTVPYCAIKLGRKGLATELNPGYFADGCAYVEAASRAHEIPTLFDLSSEEATA